jgi:hypothetical protein
MFTRKCFPSEKMNLWSCLFNNKQVTNILMCGGIVCWEHILQYSVVREIDYLISILIFPFMAVTTKTHQQLTEISFMCWIFKQCMEARNRVGIGLSYRPARLHSLAELVPWNRFLGSLKLKVKKFGLWPLLSGLSSMAILPTPHQQ